MDYVTSQRANIELRELQLEGVHHFNGGKLFMVMDPSILRTKPRSSQSMLSYPMHARRIGKDAWTKTMITGFEGKLQA